LRGRHVVGYSAHDSEWRCLHWLQVVIC
jgi:hypothetical protein